MNTLKNINNMSEFTDIVIKILKEKQKLGYDLKKLIQELEEMKKDNLS